MTQIISNIVQNSLSGLVSGAVTTVGGYAGSAVNGVGNLIENAGDSVGNGIARSFQGAGDYINSYGTGVQNATAPNAGGYKRVEAKSKPAASSKVGEKKALPSSGAGQKKALPSSTTQKALPSSTSQRALPSTKPLKALPAPPAKKDDVKKDDGKKLALKAPSYYQPPSKNGDSYKPKSTTGNGGYTPPTSANRKAEPVKSRTLQSGKVTVSKESLPGPKALNLKASSSYGAPAAGKAGSVVNGGNGGQKAFGGHLPEMKLPEKPGAKAPSRAPTVVGGNGNKSGAKPAPSKAGSVVGSQYGGGGGGPKFF